jgi:predicted acyltransferase
VQFPLLSKYKRIEIYRTVVLPVVLYGCETWSLTLREEYRLRVLERRALKEIFVPNRNELTGEWRGALCCVLITKYSGNQIKEE